MEKSRKTVKFFEDENLCVYHAGAVMDFTSASPQDIWYQQSELAHIKRKAVVVSKEAHRYGLGSLLTNTYGKDCKDTQDALNTWARNGSSRRGLERWINNEYAAKRADIRRRTIQSVLRAQMKMKEEGIDDSEYSMKVLSRLSEAFSQDSRVFARVMGIADEQAMVEHDTNTAVEVNKGKVIEPAVSTAIHLIAASSTSRSKRNLGLQVASHGAGDFRHFY